MKHLNHTISKDSYRMNLEFDIKQSSQITLGHYYQDDLIVLRDDESCNLQISYRWNIQQDKPVQEGRYRVLLFDKKKNSPYYFPSWHIAKWDGESFILYYLHPAEVGYGEVTYHEDVSARVIRWEKLPDWMPIEVVG